MTMFATNPELQLEIEKLYEALNELAPDGLLSYETMSRLLGYSIKQKPWVLMRAKKRFENNTGLRVGTVRGEGVRKLTAEAVPGLGAVARKRIGRIAKRGSEQLIDLRYNDIDSRVQARIDAERSLLGAISAVASTQGNHMAKETRTGPIVPAAVFDHLRPTRTGEEIDEAA
jgi:hypothetical protein